MENIVLPASVKLSQNFGQQHNVED